MIFTGAMRRALKGLILAAAALVVVIPAGFGSPVAHSLGGGLYAYISENDASCNSRISTRHLRTTLP
jgi:hypothetical protein